MIRRLHGLLGLVVLLALSIGLPWLLAVTIGNPLHQWSSIRAGDMSDQDVIAIMAVVAYAAWATFAIALVIELPTAFAAVVTRRPRQQFRIPLLGLQQELARSLIAAVLLLGPATANSVGPTATALADPGPATSIPVAAQVLTPSPAANAQHIPNTPRDGAPSRNTRATTLYQIPDQGGFRSYWALAEHYLGDGQRWQEIWHLNEGRHQADGSVMDSPQMLRGGWTVVVPEQHAAAGEQAVTVAPGDTLTEIAEDHHVPEPAIWALNEDRVMPDGRILDDPNLIKPGDTIDIPAQSPSETPGRPSDTQPASPQHRATEHRVSEPPSPAPTKPPEPVTPTPSAAEPADPAPATEQSQGAHDAQSSDVPMLAFAGGGGLLLAGVSLTALVRYRRRQFRRRNPGRSIGQTPPELIRMERAVLGAGYAGMADVTWLDQALRSLVHSAAETPEGRLPDVIAVRMTRDLLELVLTGPAGTAPPPWQVDEAQTRWSVRREDSLPYTAEQRGSYFAPFPTLASVGYTSQGEHWLLDLERIAALSLSGDAERCLNLARFLAAELAHNTWSEMLQVTLVGFGEELVAANPGRLSYTDDLSSAVTEVSRQFDTAAQGMRSLDTDVLSGRLHDIVGDLWAPHVLLIAPHLAADQAGLDRLLDTMREQKTRTTVALVLADDPDRVDAVRWHMTVDAQGTLSIPALDLELIAQQIPAEEAAQLAQMLALAALSEDEPIPAAHGGKPWDNYSDACGGLAMPQEPADAAAPHPNRGPSTGMMPALHLAESAPWRNSLLPLSPQTYLDSAATTEADMQALAPIVDDNIREQVEQADPQLDADLEAWLAQDCPRPRITLLGDVRVRAQGALPGHSPQVAFHTEAAAYLATRPNNGVLSSVYAQMMWPNDPDVVGKPKVRQSITSLRKWLGRDPVTGEEYLPSGLHESGTARYCIQNALVDAELFRRLRLRGISRGAEGIADLWRALDLVEGRPFGDLPQPRLGSPGGYLWVTDANARLDHEYAAMIVDTAHTVSIHHFGAGQPEQAAKAAQVALRSGTYEDVPLLDLVRACVALDQQAEAESYVQQILTNHDAEVEEDLPPRTAQVLFRLRRHWDERAS